MRGSEETTMHRTKLPLDEEYWRNYRLVDQYLIRNVSETDRKIFINETLEDKATSFKEYLIAHGCKIKSVGKEENSIVMEYSIPSQDNK